MFRADFGHLQSYLQCKLFNQYCCSFYGSPLWLLSSRYVSALCVAWRKALRKIWRLHPMTHCDIVALISNSLPLEISLQSRFCNFRNTIFKHGSSLLKSVANEALCNPSSVFCNNFIELKDSRKTWHDSLPVHVKSNVSVLRDMIDVRDGIVECAIFNDTDVLDIINDICIN